MDPIIWEWVNLLGRWLHVVTAVAWIGSSFYFIHLDASLRRRDHLPAGTAGEAWQIHGGGFYHMQKYLVAPPRLPDELTWFKWEAYTTWISGFFLMCVLYYRGADLFLIDAEVLALQPWQAVAISVAALAAGWLAYDGLCRSPLGRNDAALAAAGFVLLVATAWAMTRLFSGRGAMLQMGALMGTMMAANVFLVIMPNQRRTIAAMLRGETPDPALGKKAKQRSLHNNYLTLPVIFLMIGNHYPLATSTRFNWVIVAIVLVAGAAIRHFFNSRHAGKPTPWWTWGVAAAGMLAAVWLSGFGPALPAGDSAATRPAGPRARVGLAEVEEIVSTRCTMCHAAQPVWEGIVTAPRGVTLDSPAAILRHAGAIRVQAGLSRAMPPANVTGLTAGERAVLAAWTGRE
ncbi:urate hydroxylase PuuD [Azospirillum thermophilum]|uniref:Cysteine desulfurase n=1 Tax=Azospirillum thermophilum TaxID=2202148 RepID=A0A2S2CZS9_9PROT|nr:urate hydroxylase PuuD [Azospirillum thermophilum]AWK89948.1 cysteine desulfurase [Azospirillum thermophilum]